MVNLILDRTQLKLFLLQLNIVGRFVYCYITPPIKTFSTALSS